MKRILLLILALLLFASPARGMREIGYDDRLHPQMGPMGGFEPETEAYAATHTMTDAEKLALDLEIKGIKSGTPLTLTSVTCNLSLASGVYFITRSSVDLTRYTGIAGVQFSVAATGTPATTAVFGGTITAGVAESLGANRITNPGFETGDPPTGWSPTRGSVAQIADPRTGSSGTKAAVFTRNSEGTTGYIIRTASVSIGMLIKGDAWLKNITTSLAELVSSGSEFGVPVKTWGTTNSTSWTNVSSYATASAVTVSAILRWTGADTTTGEGDDVGYYQVLTPDALGLTASTLTNGGINANSTSYAITVSKT